MKNTKTHTCCDCGYVWGHGKHGGHNCSDYLKKDITFLLNRAKKAGSCAFRGGRDTGMSSNALVTFAYTGEEPTVFPWDDDDYGACERAYLSLPYHRRTKSVMGILENMRLKVEELKEKR